MNIEIKLDDPKYCDGCPLIAHDWNNDGGTYICILNFWSEEKGKEPEKVYINKKTGRLTCVDEIGHPKNVYGSFNNWCLKTIRPQECIDKYGL